MYKFPKHVQFVEDVPAPVTRGWIFHVLALFAESPFTILVFPSSLSSRERQEIHFEANKNNFSSKSFGVKNVDRHIQVFKGSLELKASEAWQQIPIGTTSIYENFGINLILGSGRDVRSQRTLTELDVDYVVNCSPEWEEDSDFFSSLGISSYSFVFPDKLDSEDEKKIIKIFQNFSNFVENISGESGGTVVMVHCNDGNSLSPYLLMAYLILKQNLSFGESLSRITSKRPSISPSSVYNFFFLIYFN
eukprot:TRINITY_DN9780_c0_g1_i3.p1 TRINITY_DN9780_c0_g1~~TRINITY_DN9780_c0_g1_i3.p1  ORF type:complete len:248 (-),score=40.97 TRINITY_DN9780_c0_g1_i3:1144-1887(-)